MSRVEYYRTRMAEVAQYSMPWYHYNKLAAEATKYWREENTLTVVK